MLSALLMVPSADELLQLADLSVHDPAGNVHGDVRHREPEGSAALSLLSQANWGRDELWFPHGSPHGFRPALLRGRKVRCQHKHTCCPGKTNFTVSILNATFKVWLNNVYFVHLLFNDNSSCQEFWGHVHYYIDKTFFKFSCTIFFHGFWPGVHMQTAF